MPPKVKITKEDIINTAVELIRSEGMDALNARAVASALGCSTQPVFSNFATMDELFEAAVAAAYEIYLGFIKREAESGKYPRYKAFGRAYIRFAEEEKHGSYVLGNFKDTNEPALLWKQFEDYASVYSLLPCIPYQILREVIAMSNGHIYSRTGDVLMAGGQYVAIRAMSDGEKRIHFPFPVSKVVDAYTDEEMVINDLYIDFEMKEKETRIFRVTAK